VTRALVVIKAVTMAEFEALAVVWGFTNPAPPGGNQVLSERRGILHRSRQVGRIMR
jgi:hypothetical protein